MLFSSDKNSLKASIVDNTLVVSFISKGNPRALRIDLGKFLSSALEIREDHENFSLVLKPNNMEAEEIGIFPNKKRAAEALQVIVDAMLKSSTATPPEKESGGFIMAFLKFIWFLFLTGVVLVCVVFIFVSITNKQRLSLNSTTTAPTVGTEKQQVLVEPPVPTGVPVPAEQALPEN